MRRSVSGFTLFEVLIAVSIFALIGTIAMTNLIQVGKAGERITHAQQQLSEIQFVLGYMSKDLAQLIDRKVRDRYGDEQNQFILADKVMTFTRTGWANLLQQKRSQLQRVSYRLEDDKLLREYWLELDQGYEEQKVQQPLLSDVENFEVKLITPGEDKLDTWPPDTEEPNAPRPLAIEVNLEIKGFGLVTRIFEVTDVF